MLLLLLAVLRRLLLVLLRRLLVLVRLCLAAPTPTTHHASDGTARHVAHSAPHRNPSGRCRHLQTELSLE